MPGMRGTLLSRVSTSPMKWNSSTSTSMPSGTMISMPPMIAVALIVIDLAVDLGLPQIDLAAAHQGEGVQLLARAPAAGAAGAAHDADDVAATPCGAASRGRGCAPQRSADRRRPARGRPCRGVEHQGDAVGELVEREHALAAVGRAAPRPSRLRSASETRTAGVRERRAARADRGRPSASVLPTRARTGGGL